MITVDPNPTCEQAKIYYYEYLCGEPSERIPTEMLAHIDKCRSCQDEVKRLKEVLAEGEDRAVGSAGQMAAVVTTSLRFHFAYLGAFVGCDTAKLFLPSLAIPALKVVIPTPITVHLDKCQQCASDLEAIRQLKLTDNHLGRLGQLFAEESKVDANACAKAQQAIDSVGAMVLENTSASVLRHLCVCPECRKLLYEDRKGRSENLPKNLEQSPIRCDTVSTADIFDYVVPYGIDPDQDQYVKFRKSLTSHLVNCPRCLDKMQRLHDTLYGILERGESGIVTCYEVCDSGRDSTMGGADEMYEDWPMRVKVFEPSGVAPEEASGHREEASRRPKRRLSLPKAKPFIKAAAVAAAVVLVALLLLHAPVAKAIDLSQIHEALERIKNVCITTYYQEESSKTQEIWISRTLNVKMLKTGTGCFLWDINAKSQKSKNLNTGSVEVQKLGGNVLAKVQETMEGPLGLLPFNSVAEAPRGARWLPVANEDVEDTIPGAQVYELTWTVGKAGGLIVYNKWRGYVDVETALPRKVEWLEKRSAEQEYELSTIMRISYPRAAEIQMAIKDSGF